MAACHRGAGSCLFPKNLFLVWFNEVEKKVKGSVFFWCFVNRDYKLNVTTFEPEEAGESIHLPFHIFVAVLREEM